jgi:hypothetical protein
MAVGDMHFTPDKLAAWLLDQAEDIRVAYPDSMPAEEMSAMQRFGKAAAMLMDQQAAVGRVTQQDAARLMYAHAKAMRALCAKERAIGTLDDAKAAEAAFADLVAGMTLDETE